MTAWQLASIADAGYWLNWTQANNCRWPRWGHDDARGTMTFNRGLFSSASGDWETPQELFDELDKEFHFELDPCAAPGTAKCATFICLEGDGLSQPWALYGIPSRVFANPPYGREIGMWVKKGLLESSLGSTVVMLLPARTDTAWWHDYVMKADEIRFIRGRLKFSGHKNSAPFPSCIVVFRPARGREVKP